MRPSAWLLVVAAVLAGCGDDEDGEPGVGLAVETTIDFEPDTEPVALAALGRGELLVGERRTGVVRSVSARGDLSEPIARLDVTAAEDDQRGLLGLTVHDEQIYAAWTRASDGRIVVAEITDGVELLVWEGPPSSRLANGGHLAVMPDGRLLIGIGDLQQPDQIDDPDSPNGKLLALDPAGPPEQTPTVLSSGWNNPFAFVVTTDGEVWVADNAPGDIPERLGRGDIQSELIDLPGKRAPAALVELAPDRLGLCGYLDGQLTAVDIRNDQPEIGEPTDVPCRSGAIALDNGRIAVTDGERLHILVENRSPDA